jgi:hypothetical protein
MTEAKGEDLAELGACAEQARSLPAELALSEGSRRRITVEIEARRHGQRSALALYGAPLVLLLLLLAAPVEVALFESALRFTDLAEPTVRLLAVGTVAAFEAALFIALFRARATSTEAQAVLRRDDEDRLQDELTSREQAL